MVANQLMVLHLHTSVSVIHFFPKIREEYGVVRSRFSATDLNVTAFCFGKIPK